MAVISIFSLILLAFVIVVLNKKTNEEESSENSNGVWKKIGLSLLLFIPFFIGYYMIVAIIICIPLAITMVAGQAGWAYGIIGGFALSPLLTVITILKLVWRNK